MAAHRKADRGLESELSLHLRDLSGALIRTDRLDGEFSAIAALSTIHRAHRAFAKPPHDRANALVAVLNLIPVGVLALFDYRRVYEVVDVLDIALVRTFAICRHLRWARRPREVKLLSRH